MTWPIEDRTDLATETEDRRTEDFHRNVEQHDRALERADATPRRRGLTDAEIAARLHPHSGTVTAAPIDPPLADLAPDLVDCDTCGGDGYVTVRGRSLNPGSGMRVPDPQCDREEPCHDCGATGLADAPTRTVVDDTCTDCLGTGRIHIGEWERCQVCNGTGRLS